MTSPGRSGGGSFGPGSVTSNPSRSYPKYQGGAGAVEKRERAMEGRVAVPPAKTPSAAGQWLFDVLDMPDRYTGSEVFTMGIDRNGRAVDDGFGGQVNRAEVVQMTVSAGLEWLRDQAVQNKEGYNAWVAELYSAGYLSESDVRFNRYTSKVGQAFVEAAYDVAQSNLKNDVGEVITLADHLAGLAEGFAESGFGPNGGGGGGRQAPTRVNRFTDEATVKETLRATSRSLLGRALTDEEEASLLGRFRSLESSWNDQAYAADMAQFNGKTATINDQPNISATAPGMIRDRFAQEKAGEDLGSYVGVLQRMLGLNGGGIGADI